MELEDVKVKTPKRQDYISWDEYFMGIAMLSGHRSKDPSTQVGACIVDKDNRILSIGYNGLPRGFDDNDISWNTEGELLDTRDPYVCHAELNAILNFRGTTLEGSKIYVDLFPCHECTKAIIQSGIKEVIYHRLRKPNSDKHVAAKRMFENCGVKMNQYISRNRNITLEV
ncbi:tRNA-specific adenosine deaminase [compost metagenome]